MLLEKSDVLDKINYTRSKAQFSPFALETTPPFTVKLIGFCSQHSISIAIDFCHVKNELSSIKMHTSIYIFSLWVNVVGFSLEELISLRQKWADARDCTL